MKTVCAIIFFILPVVSAYSQNIVTDVFLEQHRISNSPLVDQVGIDLFNKIIINQLIKTNDTEVMKFQDGYYITGNISDIFQQGNENYAGIMQTGKNNTSSAKQMGDNNYYNLELTGNNNYSDIIQNGNENSILQILSGNEMYFPVFQYGNNNEFIHVEAGTDGKQMIITQTGGMKLIIR